MAFAVGTSSATLLNRGIRGADQLSTTCRPRCEGLTHMEHVVFYPALDGAPAFRRFVSLDDAVRFVEHLRNAEGVSEVSVHALAPVPLSFRAYYKVEVPVDEAAHEPAHAVAEVPAQIELAQIEPAYDAPAADV